MLKSTSHGNDECCDKESDDDKGGGFDFNNVLNKHSSSKRRVFLWGELDDHPALSIVSQLQYLSETSSEPIQVIINSVGGSVDAMYSILDEMRAIQDEGIIVSTIVSGVAYSAASFILAMGSPGYRYARPNANIMMHPMSYGLGQDYAEYQEKMTEFYKKVNLKNHKHIMQALGIKGEKNYKKFLSEIDKGLWLTAEEALERKIVDKIWTKPLAVPFKKG